MAQTEKNPKRIVLAYSGGLDTSVILPWLKQRYPGVKLVAFAAELGQGDELKSIATKAQASGADQVIVKDLRKEFVEHYCFPLLRAHAAYEADYLLGTAAARPLIAKHQVQVAKEVKADAVAHGATAKGNDQIRFELTYMALNPKLKIITPWKDPEFGLTSREAALDYAKQHGIPVEQSNNKLYSRDRNLWHMSHEGAEIEDPSCEPQDRCLVLSVPVAKAPDKPAYVEVEFEKGNPVALDGKRFDSTRSGAHELVHRLNNIGGQHAVGQTVMVENRRIGMKSRGVYEAPGATILYEAHKALEQLCLERELYHHKLQLAPRYAELVYDGHWFHPLRVAIQAFMDQANQVVTGVARVKLFKGRAQVVSAESPTSLYDLDLASFGMKGYDVTAARGFIDLIGLPTKIRGLKQKGTS